MKKIINALLGFTKYLLLVAGFALTLYIIVKMNLRLEKPFTQSIDVFIPYLLLFIAFIVTVFVRRDSIQNNLFYNITCNLVFITNIFVGYRAIFDKNMLFNIIQKMGVNFNYFNNYLAFNKLMLYGLFIGTVLFLLIPNNNEEKVVLDSKTVKVVKKVPKTKKEKETKTRKKKV